MLDLFSDVSTSSVFALYDTHILPVVGVARYFGLGSQLVCTREHPKITLPDLCVMCTTLSIMIVT